MSFRSEHSANLSLIPTTKRPTWTNPSTCVRTKLTLWQRIINAVANRRIY